MEKRNVTKTAALALVAATIAAHIARLATNTPAAALAVTATHAPLPLRTLYPLIHANILHLAINDTTLLTIAFRHTPHPAALALALATTIAIPHACLNNTPTVGLSVALYTLLGIITVGQHWRQYLLWCTLTLTATLPLPHLATLAHLYGYAVGIAAALLTTPLPWHTTTKKK